MWEAGENTEFVINLFRETSGPSEDYRGDSKVNVVGDMISCSLGYSLSYILSRYLGGSIIPALIYLIVSELYLAITIRDNILIIALQILTNSEALKEWQLEAIPPGAVDRGRAGYWMKNMKSEKFKRRLSLAAEKVLSGSAERLDWTQPSVAPHAALLY